MTKIRYYYRLSSNNYKKGKLPGATKERCLINFWDACRPVSPNIIADNCDKFTSRLAHDMVQDFGGQLFGTELGNAGAIRFAIDRAISHPDEDIVYFVEDDYLHLENPCPKDVIEEGLQHADYVTLYDHPDKYMNEYECGEETKVFRTTNSHWKYSASTTMTFATKVGTLKKDLDTWMKWTNGDHPHDHQIFMELGPRRLAVAIPGLAVHTDLTYSEYKGQVMIEQWAIDMMEKWLLDGSKNMPTLPPELNPIQRLMMIAAFVDLKNKPA